MPRKITLNSASGGAAPSSSGLTTAEVNALIAADNAKYEPQWELVESRDIAPGENPDWAQLVFDRDLYKNYEVKLIFNNPWSIYNTTGAARIVWFWSQTNSTAEYNSTNINYYRSKVLTGSNNSFTNTYATSAETTSAFGWSSSGDHAEVLYKYYADNNQYSSYIDSPWGCEIIFEIFDDSKLNNNIMNWKYRGFPRDKYDFVMTEGMGRIYNTSSYPPDTYKYLKIGLNVSNTSTQGWWSDTYYPFSVHIWKRPTNYQTS